MVRDRTEKAGLTLHPVKTKPVDAVADGFDFLGYHFERGRRWPRKKSMDKLKDAIRAKTGRNVGQGLTMLIADIVPALRGWFAYFQHSYRPTFRIVDGWVRRRLRSILRRQQRLEGISKRHGADHVRMAECLFCQTRTVQLARSPGGRMRSASPLVGKTTDWRAVCGRSASTVRRAGM